MNPGNPTPTAEAPRTDRARPARETLVRATDLEAAQALRPTDAQDRQRRVPRWWGVALVVVVTGSWWLLMARNDTSVGEAAGGIAGFVRQLAGTGGSARPAFLQPAQWAWAGQLAAETVVMTVIAVGLAGAGALLTLAFASRTLTTGDFAVLPPAAGRAVYAGTRGLYVCTRAIPDYLWALIVVLVIQPGILTGAVAMALHNLGVMGRLAGDAVEDLDEDPLLALRSSGAGNVQILCYGALPQVLPQLLTFLLYRWEVMIRASAVVGFVAAAGIGYELRLAMSRFDYTQIALLLAVYVLVVFAVDLISGALRRLAR